MSKTLSHFSIPAVASAAVCTAAFAVLLSPSVALADDAIAHSVDSSGDYTYYYNIDQVKAGGYNHNTIVMDSDWELSDALVVDDSKTLIIDMNGHSIHSTDDDYAIRMNEHSKLTLTSSGSGRFCYRGYENDNVENKCTEYDCWITAGGLITDDNDGTGIKVDAYSTLTLDNVAVAGNAHSGVVAEKQCHIDMKNGATVAHNSAKSYGGGIQLHGDSELAMDNATITDNFCGHYGGGVFVESDTDITMENNSKIENNLSMAGGGIYFNYSGNTLISKDKTAEISRNEAYRPVTTDDKVLSWESGGALHFDTLTGNDGGTVKGITFNRNYSSYDGGAIEVDQRNVTIEDCTITDNKAEGEGGGIYVYSKNCTIKNCTITGNICNLVRESSEADEQNYAGGGVFVYYDVDVILRGKCVIKGNTRGTHGSADDLYLMENTGNSIRAYITGGIEKGTKVGVRTGIAGTRKIGVDLSSNCYGAFFIDLPGYYVGYQYDDHGNMQQNTGSLVFSTNINSTYTGRYEQGKTVTANGTSYDSDKVFWYWDAEKTTGLYPVSEFINSKNMYNPFLTYSMPQNDVKTVAVYAKRVKAAILVVAEPKAGEALPESAMFRRSDAGNGAQMTIPVGVTWYEIKADGSKVVASGNAKPGTEYVASFNVEQNQKYGLFFEKGLGADDVTVYVGSNASNAAKAASASVDASTGALRAETAKCKTEGTAPTEENAGKVTVNEVNGGLQALAGDSGKSTQDADADVLDTVDFYYSKDSESVTITAPAVDGMNFCNWEGVDDSWVSDDIEGTVTIPMSDLKEDLELTAVYTPVIAKLEVGLSAPKAGKKLAAKATSLVAVGSDGETLDLMGALGKQSLSVEWAPGDKSAAYSTAYAAIVKLADAEGLEGTGSAFAQDAIVTLSDGAVSTSANFAVFEGKICLLLMAPDTADVAAVKGLKAAKTGKGAVKVSWKKASRSGVQVRYSTAKSMKSAKKVTVKGKAAKAKKVKKLKSGKRYYFQVRAYKTVNGLKCYSSWSDKVSVKVK